MLRSERDDPGPLVPEHRVGQNDERFGTVRGGSLEPSRELIRRGDFERLQLLKEAAPAILRIAALWNPAETMSIRRATEEAGRILGLELRTKLRDLSSGFVQGELMAR
jgi:hypothetical protein